MVALELHERFLTRINRPSASVSMTSIDFPFIALITSPKVGRWYECHACNPPLIFMYCVPGFVALPDGRFSHSGVTAVTFSGKPSLQIPYSAPATVAAPPISPFIKAMLLDGFKEIPPLQTNI